MNLQSFKSPVLEKIFSEGHTTLFVFADGFLQSAENPKISYLIPKVDKRPMPCFDSESIIYKIITSDGILGYAILLWIDFID